MKSCKEKTGFTLVEMLIVVTVIAILVSTVISIASRIDSKAKEQLTESTIAILAAALGQFGDYGYKYPDYSDYSDSEAEFYRSLVFPADYTGLSKTDFEDELGKALNLEGKISISDGTHENWYSASEALYFFLSQVPACRKTLDEIDGSLVTNKGSDKQEMFITVDGKKYPLLRVIDPWGTTLRYDYYDETETNPDKRRKSKRNFPLITSGGADREFGTTDDITNR